MVIFRSTLTIQQFRILPLKDLAPGTDAGTEFTSVCINVALYLPYLVGQCRKYGVVIRRRILKHIHDAEACHHSGDLPDIIINCTGLMASKLGGVEDQSLTPARGQTVLVRNELDLQVGVSGTNEGPEETAYFMTRASGGGTVLGGSYQLGNWESQPDLNLATRIMQRAVDLHPELANGKGVAGLSIIRHAVGLRPYRKDGVRLEKEKIEGAWVVHNYGHAGYGYQTSYACAGDVVGLVEGIVREKTGATM